MASASAERSLGTTQARILQVILRADKPLPVETLCRVLEISRNATYQHVVALERDGLIEKARVTQTKGRPSQTYQLTEKGRATFPKHYALFAQLLIGLVKSRMGGKELEACLSDLGETLADEYLARVAELDGDELTIEVAAILMDLGYQAEAVPNRNGQGLEIRAHNCVFHDLAKEHEEVCALDLSLISHLTRKPIEHAECVVRGGTSCRFCYKT